MTAKPKEYRFLVYPYLFTMLLIIMVSMIAFGVWLLVGARIVGDRRFVIAFVSGLELLIFGTIICNSREWLGWYTITTDSVTLHAPFRRALTLRYDDVQHVGVGRNWLSVNCAYWMYLSCDPVPLAQLEDMRKFRLTERALRIAYSKKAFDALIACLPEHHARQMERSKTTLRTWGVIR